jgi:hypothetical protein
VASNLSLFLLDYPQVKDEAVQYCTLQLRSKRQGGSADQTRASSADGGRQVANVVEILSNLYDPEFQTRLLRLDYTTFRLTKFTELININSINYVAALWVCQVF